MNLPERLFTGLLVVALAGAGYAYYQAQTRQAATLARIAALDTCLTTSNQQRARASNNTILSMSEAVRKNHNWAQDVVVLKQAKKIQTRTQTLLDTLHQIRQSWQVIGRRTELQQLPEQLKHYVAFIRNFVPDAPLLNYASPRIESVGWLGEVDTAREPKPAALALLTKLETQVRQVEAEALMYQAQKVGSWCGFDKMGAFAAANSNTVAPGAIYQAQLALVIAAWTSGRHFSADGRAVLIDPATGQGLVQFKVPAARAGQPDTMRAAWHGRVQIPWAASDTVLETTVPYFIVKPLPR